MRILASFLVAATVATAAWGEEPVVNRRGNPRLFGELTPQLPLGAWPGQLGATQPCCVNVLDWGCVLDNKDFDNGPILNERFAKLGNKPGGCNLEVYIPGGALYFSTPIEFPDRSGMAIRGNGITHALVEGAYVGRTQYGGPASRLVYVGPAQRPAITYSGVGLRIDGIVLQRGEVENRVPAKADGSIGLSIAGLPTPPSGKLQIGSLATFGWDIAIDVPPGTHADNNQFQFWRIEDCNTGLRCRERQSVGWQVQYVQTTGIIDTVFDFQDGGDFQCQFLALSNANPSLVLRLGHLRRNSCQFQFQKIKIDNHAEGWRLVEMQRPQTLSLYVRGIIGEHSSPAKQAIVLKGDPAQQDIDIRMFWRGGIWPSADR